MTIKWTSGSLTVFAGCLLVLVINSMAADRFRPDLNPGTVPTADHYSVLTTPFDGDSILMESFLKVMVFPPAKGYSRITINRREIEERGLRASLKGERPLILNPELGKRTKGAMLKLTEPASPGEWELSIPSGYFYLDSPTRELDSAPADTAEFMSLTAKDAWHVSGTPWQGPGMFSVHDDDAIDSFIPTSRPSAWMTGGCLSTCYPLLESLGIKGNVAAEGQRMGLTVDPPVLSYNGVTLRKLQNERGWDIMSHTMTARYYTRNWYVESLDSELADKILREATYAGETSNLTTSVYDAETGRQYQVNADRSGWVETDSCYIKAYVSDYRTGKVMMSNPLFSVDYQHGEWFRLARKFGINARTWTSCGGIISHANVREINEICPWGFADLEHNGINVPPFGSTVTRMSVDGLYLDGYKGETDTDNSFNQKHFEFYKSKIDETAEKGGWVVLSMHGYRPAYYNYRPGALVSEGGTYPDEWVFPVRSIDKYPDTYLDPPVEKGINDWSEWYPCPGTRLEMIWQLCKYAKEKGLIPVTSSEGFERMGNKVNVGLFTKGGAYDIDREIIIGTRDNYPHYVVGANGEQYYYNREETYDITATYYVYDAAHSPEKEQDNNPTTGPVRAPSQGNGSEENLLDVISPDGIRYKVKSLGGLREGLWIVNGRKVLIRKK